MENTIPAFETWLLRYGRAQSTVDLYVFLVRKALAQPDMVQGLMEKDLSPKYRRLMKSARMAWAKFHGNMDLATELDQVQLPSPVRQKAKQVLSRESWLDLMDACDASEVLQSPMKAIIGIMGRRGLRMGDVLRLKRAEISQGLKSSTLSFEAKGGRRMEFGITSAYRKYIEMLDEGLKGKAVWALVAKTPNAAQQSVRRALVPLAATVPLGIEFEASDIHPHLLRATYATHFYEAVGADPHKLMTHMQWAKIETAMGYVAQTKRSELDAVAEGMFR